MKLWEWMETTTSYLKHFCSFKYVPFQKWGLNFCLGGIMKKSAVVDFPVLNIVKERWSPRAFSDKPVESEVIKSLFEAARWAPSAMNEQPWRFIFAQKAEDLKKARSMLVEQNEIWASKAPILLLTFVKTNFSHQNAPNPWAEHDLGQAAAWLTVEATHRGLMVHQMAGIKKDLIKSAFSVPDNYEPVTAIAIGYPAIDAESLPEPFKSRELEPRTRKPQSEIIGEGKFPS